MGIYLGVHDFGGAITEQDMKHNWENYQKSCQEHGAEAKGVYFNLEEGMAYCVTKAESAADVDAAHNDINRPTKELHAVEKLK